ncbi:DUF2254 domain-containing protein [Jannaschia sp. CCS1]|uniref:DUF2254 domain-containing protein n=1 Tax=Jannaschia sp. (strain CCS1) TaxID=290400 RepID=UPI000053D567|nr:DUF2254 domain-containing protein [Jannaschia sp. CCS1]ABD55259.1 hypothetical protein Jann_2342 [Jannaschia sp. CCS1]
MISKWLWTLRSILRQLWVRVAAYAALAMVAASAAPTLSPLVPDGWGDVLGDDAVDSVLTILTTAMLPVTTFSLSIAVNAYSAAAQTATPRAIALLQEDPTTQKTLATFLGAFVFAVVAVIGLSANYYDTGARVILFLASSLVVLVVVFALLRWIGYLQDFGRMENILDRVEEAARDSLNTRLDMPYLGGHPARDPAPDYAHDIHADATGYVQHIDVDAINTWAEDAGAQVWLAAMPGDYVTPGATLVRVNGPAPPDTGLDEVRDAFAVDRQRSYDQDPRHGMIVLSEIASRALSPSVNDAGTAIAVIDRQLSVLLDWRARREPDVVFDAVYVASVEPLDMVDAAFRPIIRDAANHSEVLERLILAFQVLRTRAPEVFDAPVGGLLDDLDNRVARSDGLSDWDLDRINRCRE